MSGESALVLVTSSFPISGDGSEAAGAFVADLAGALAGHLPVRVVAPGKANAKEAWAAGVEVFRYQAPDRPLSTLRPWHPAEAWQVAGVLRNGALATERAMQAGPVAHVLALWALPCGDWARRSARKHGVGYSAWTLGSDIWSLGRIPLVRTHLRTILRDAQYCWSDGFKLAQDTHAIVGRDVDFLPSTRKMDRVRSGPLRTEPPYRLLFLGRWHLNKGVDLLIEALEGLPDADWARIERVTVAGGGPMEPLVRTGVERLRSTGRPVELRGYLDREEAQQAMLDADYLLIPSRIESIPVVFSDAMKLHCPVVAMPVGDLPALLATDPACGVVAQSATGPGFAAGLRAALRRAPAEFIEGVKLQSQRFDLEMVAQRLATELVDRMPDVAGRGGADSRRVRNGHERS